MSARNLRLIIGQALNVQLDLVLETAAFAHIANRDQSKGHKVWSYQKILQVPPLGNAIASAHTRRLICVLRKRLSRSEKYFCLNVILLTRFRILFVVFLFIWSANNKKRKERVHIYYWLLNNIYSFWVLSIWWSWTL